MGLTLEQMVRMSELLDEAMELDAVGRERWLGQLPLKDQDLIEALREALFPNASVLDSPAALAQGETLGRDERPASGLAPGERVGPYELIRLLGTGGMAEVWLAKRADGAIKREVALKLPMLTRFRKDLEQRFTRERDILASLEHPNIARLYDVGGDAHGLPYLSMEYVPGEPLTDWCDAQNIGTRERLQLFLPVLEAVHYAHEKHVIHRDLKPSNILVSESGQVRLLDFGVAKLLAADTGEAQLTSLYGRALTPDYASPELLKGEPIDARSDVYSLGVVLYELLSGARPYRLKSGASLGMLEQAIATVEVKRPGSQIEPEAAAARSMTPDGLAQQLRGDLDVVVLKALAKEPAERYGTAAAMAEDIKSHLEDRPIAARAAPISLRARKFVRRNRPLLVVAGVASALLLGVGTYEIKRSVMVPVSVFSPPPHSIAVLPFANLSGDKNQEYFSDGLSEEILDSLTRINALQVVARTSSFSFKGKDADIGTIGRTLNVSAVLEGSVRRSGNTVRVSTELINAVTGFQLWSKSFDRDLGDLLKLQTEIADAVASALRVTLLGDESARVELGGTTNPAAFDAYLHARKAQLAGHGADGYQTAVAHFTEAIRLDPRYALALAGRAVALVNYGGYAQEQGARASFDEAHKDALRAIALAPDLAEGHLALAAYFDLGLDFTRAHEEYERALTLGPGNARVLQDYGQFAVMMGRREEGIAAVLRARLLDPLDPATNDTVGFALLYAREYQQAISAFQATLTLNPDYSDAYVHRGLAYFALGNLQGARASCESKPGYVYSQECLAMVYDKLGRHADAEAQLAKVKASEKDEDAFQYVEIYAQWGDKAKAVEWLETALRLHDVGLDQLKSDPFVDPVRNDPRFQAIEKTLRFIE